MNKLKLILTIVIGLPILTFTSCSKFVTREAIQAKISSVPNTYEIDIYYSEEEVPMNYEVIGYFEWRKSSMLAHRKKIGKKIMKKTNSYIRSGKLSKPDGIIVNDFIHATYIRHYVN